jgi:hypothetical protein
MDKKLVFNVLPMHFGHAELSSGKHLEYKQQLLDCFFKKLL